MERRGETVSDDADKSTAYNFGNPCSDVAMTGPTVSAEKLEPLHRTAAKARREYEEAKDARQAAQAEEDAAECSYWHAMKALIKSGEVEKLRSEIAALKARVAELERQSSEWCTLAVDYMLKDGTLSAERARLSVEQIARGEFVSLEQLKAELAERKEE
jgi:polyhydroxyalkanoate synthesis regulator phasin